MRGTSLILLFFLLIAIFHYSRWALPEKDELPAVLYLQPQLVTIAVAGSGGDYGLFQFSDGDKITDVIKLTETAAPEKLSEKNLNEESIRSGERIKLVNSKGNCVQVERTWMSARHRILLQIPLHPDRMTLLDWESLPGIGAQMAAVIEYDRQKNGDFGDFLGLDRVKGVGPKKLEAWQEYFVEKKTQRKKL